MKKLLPFVFLLSCIGVHAQNVGVGTKYPLSKLHVAGDLRVDSLAGKGTGIVTFDHYGVLSPLKFSGSKKDVLHGDGSFAPLNATSEISSSWLTTGNSGTDSSNFLGTTDDQPLRFKTNNINAGVINSSNGLVALGAWTLDSNTSGFNNVAIGNSSLRYNTAGRENTAIGSSALISNSTGSSNTAVGQFSLGFNTSGSFNTALGMNALANNHTGSYNIAVGLQSSYSANTGSYNVSLGFGTLYHNRSGSQNTGVGTLVLAWNAEGNSNTAIGYKALYYNLASELTAVGYQSLYSNTSGTHNTANGYRSLYLNTIGSGNTANGFGALQSNNTGNFNSSTGHQSLFSNKNGVNNSATGYKALFSNVSGAKNTADGFKALNSNTTGSNNTGHGNEALFSNITGSNNTALGAFADVTGGNFTNATAIGYNAKVNASNKVRIGNAAVTKIEGQVPFSTPSDGRYKFNVKEDVKGLDFIMRLRPVTYQFDVNAFDGQNTKIVQAAYKEAVVMRRTGFIAQEVQEAADKSNYNFSGISKPQNEKDHYSLSYEAFVVPLVKAMQEQEVTIENMKKELAEQKESNRQLAMTLDALQQEIKSIRSQFKR